jgi:hypothetical protein
MTDFPTEQLKDLLAGTYEPETLELGKTMAETLLCINERLEAVEAVRKMQEELIAVSLKKIILAAGDMLHVKSPQKLGNEILGDIYKFIKLFFPNNSVIVSDANAEIDMSVIQQEPETTEKGKNEEIPEKT